MKSIINLTFFIFLTTLLNAQEKWTIWNSANTSTSLCNNYVNDIEIDIDSSVWFATSYGVSHFKDNKWENFTFKDIRDYDILSMDIDKYGVKWFGTGYSLFKYNNNSWEFYRNTDIVNNLHIDTANNKWFGANGESYFYNDSAFIDAGIFNGNICYIDKKDNSIYAIISFSTTRVGLYKYNGSKWFNYSESIGLTNLNFSSFLIDNDGNKWLGTVENGIYKYNDTILKHYTIDTVPYNNSVISISIDPKTNNIWFCTRKGILIHEDTSWIKDTRFNIIDFVKFDNEGNTWLSERGKGVYRLKDSVITNFVNNSNIITNDFIHVAIDKQDKKWLSTGAGVNMFNNKVFFKYTQSDGLFDNAVSKCTIDKKDHKWFTTSSYDYWRNKGLSEYNDTVWKTITTKDGLISNTVRDIYFDINGTKWFGTDNGISKNVGTQWIKYRETAGLIYNSINSLTKDNKGIMWFCTDKGISEFNGTNWKSHTIANGLFKNSVKKIIVDIYNNKWIHYIYDGISKYDDKSWQLFNIKTLSGNSSITDIVFDKNNNLWILTESNGLIKYDGCTWIKYPYIYTHKGRSLAIDSKGNKWIASLYMGLAKFEDNGVGPLDLNNIQRGFVFEDMNNNGIKDSSELGIPNQIITIDSSYVVTTPSGMFCIASTLGQHVYKYKANSRWKLTTDSIFIVHSNDSITNDTLYFGVKPIENINDVSISITGTQTRANFNSQYWIDYSNLGTTTQTGKIVLQLDTLIKAINVLPPADSVLNNRFVWNINTLVSQQQKQIYLYTQMPGVQALGDTLFSTVAFYITTNDTNLINNFDTIKQRITGSYDPNDKQVKEGVGNNGYVLFNKPLIYIIRFQNTGTDTAFNVNIRDTLNNNLDVSTLKIIASSHPLRLELRGTNEATFHLDNIMLPDSNVNQAGSNGFIKYTIKPKANLPENTLVTNKAYIFFDFNPAIITNETKNTYVSIFPDTITSIDEKSNETNSMFTIYPNPTKQNVTITFNSSDKVNSIEILNTIGQTVCIKQIQTTSSSEQIDLSNLQSGIYFIKVTTDNGNFIKKIVKE